MTPKPLHVPSLNEEEKHEVQELAPAGAKIIHESIRKEGEDELSRTSSALAWSGWAAGLSMGFSLLLESALKSGLPDAGWSEAVSKLGFPAGFLIVILGRQQLFTENTLTPIIPLLARRDRATFLNVIRLWGIVLVTNLLGALTVAWALTSSIFPPELQRIFVDVSKSLLAFGFWQLILKGIFAGWLIALVAWILGGMRERGAQMVFLLTYLIGLSGFTHVVSGSVDTLYLVLSGQASLGDYFRFLIPTLLGNIVGGVALVSIANHAQVMAGGGVRSESKTSP